ncbi:hypothetical protein IMSHALPRED_003658 [Imshaugia aleurites]|uniref:MARVEL domain-containing protein n=1 Tax=Imshaugia aleurites TaxID=172621 RepID=A0A8H3J845_9LECA|nr:hypothetical protein IMSHALPRED_003658 [Imshaugia aleurites]
MLGYIFFTFWRLFQIVTLIPTLGMLAYFVSLNQKANRLTPASILTLFIVSTLAAVWAIVTLFRRKSTQRSTLYVAFVDLCFVGGFIAGVYELRAISSANCSSVTDSGPTYLSIGTNGVSGSSGISASIKKDCAMQKASFAFGIMNCIFFFITFMILLFMHRTRDDDPVQYRTEVTRKRRSHDSRRGHSRSGGGGSTHRRSSRDSRRYYV